MKNNLLLFSIAALSLFIVSCKKSGNTINNANVKVNFIFKFDSTQARLDNLGNPAPVAAGHAAQSPRFNTMSAHYLELTPDEFTMLGSGDVLYRAAETAAGGDSAIDFSKAQFAGNNDTFLTVPLSSVKPGSYKWLRVSLAYQNYNVYVRLTNPILPSQKLTVDATVASFIGFDTYLSSFKIKDSTLTVNGNRKQGFWAIEGSAFGYGAVDSGQAPPGATTVPNPIFATSPIPQGSCVVTGPFGSPLVITGKETSDINVIVSLSTNKSFEWIDADHNGTYDPQNGDQVVNMGIRGMIPSKQ